ncbi:BolA family protein [Allopusillimonas ginsengisoli]|uniref:BolA family protein n=1 Tax=Allopusillimonas ginsengisoli TaxID=453575 RepID=UPI0010C1D90E|nr:BolA family transcriptional regulator [Allopusillimonas ginsengisoli]
MPHQERKLVLQERLQALNPSHLDIVDESHLHAGHAGSRNGASHFRVHIWTDQFDGLSTVARHRLVYDRVQDLMPFPVHALAIVAKNPSF